MTRCGTDFRHQYGIFGGESQTSFTRNTTRAGSEEGRLFSQAIIHRFPCSLMCGDCMPQFHVRVCETKISTCNWWELEEFKTTCKLAFNCFWKPSVSSLYFLYKQNPKTLLHLIVSRSEQKKHLNAEIRLPYSNWFDHLSFLPFKLFTYFKLKSLKQFNTS